MILILTRVYRWNTRTTRNNILQFQSALSSGFVFSSSLLCVHSSSPPPPSFPAGATMSTDDVVLVLNGALWAHDAAGDAACASPGAYLRAWGLPGAYTCGRTFGREKGICQWAAHVTRLRHSLVALADAAPKDFEGTTLPASDSEMDALITPSVMVALSECAARGIEGPVDGTSPVDGKITRCPRPFSLLFINSHLLHVPRSDATSQTNHSLPLLCLTTRSGKEFCVSHPSTGSDRLAGGP